LKTDAAVFNDDGVQMKYREPNFGAGFGSVKLSGADLRLIYRTNNRFIAPAAQCNRESAKNRVK